MKSLEQLNQSTDQELDNLCAESQGWKRTSKLITVGMSSAEIDIWLSSDEMSSVNVIDYHPTQTTTEGKAQAFDLMSKGELSMGVNRGLWHCIYDFILALLHETGGVVKDKNTQRAIVIAFILSEQR